MSCVVGMFMVRTKKRKAVTVGGDFVVRGERGCVSSLAELCMMCKMRMNAVRG